MARLESVAVAGYYPTPVSVLSLIGSCFEKRQHGDWSKPSLLDPCAGEGEALASIAKAIDTNKIHGIEMEKNRFEKLRGVNYSGSTHGDAFMVDIKGARADVLYLNPPYDVDHVFGRLEQRFLDRFKQVLQESATLVFVVPHYALAASVETLCSEFANLECFRFPDAEWDAYKQIVLFATKRKEEAFLRDDDAATLITKWAKDANSIPLLEEGCTSRKLTTHGYVGHLTARAVDMVAIKKEMKVWYQTGRKGSTEMVFGVLPSGSSATSMNRTYTLATPPRPAHIAAGLAAGVFNGVVVNPDSNKELPPIMLKGVFNKEFQTVEEKQNKNGETTSVVQVQQPRLITTVLDMNTYKYTTVVNSAEITGSTDIEKMTMADILDNYGRGLMSAMLQQCPVIHDPTSPTNIPVPVAALARPLFPAQHEGVQALVKILGGPGLSIRRRRNKGAFLLGEIGSGKTSVALATAKTLGAGKTVVLCPPHLLDGWLEQIQLVTPEVKAVVLNTPSDIDAVARMDGPVIAILSRETAKLGHAYIGVTKRCPKCHGDLPLDEKTNKPMDVASKRLRCAHVRRVYKGKFKSIAARVEQLRKGSNIDIARLVVDCVKEKQLAIASKILAFRPSPSLIITAVNALPAMREAYSEEDRTMRNWLLLSGSDEVFEFAKTVIPPGRFTGYGSYGESFHSLYTEEKHGYGSDVNRDHTTKKLQFMGTDVGSSDHLRLAMELIKPHGRKVLCKEPLFQAIPEPRRTPLASYIVRRHRGLFDLMLMDEGHEYSTSGSAQEIAAHRLTSLGIPTILMTGSIMNGYAESLFSNMWALSAEFRKSFGRDDLKLFVDIYGYRRVITEDRNEKGEVISFGSQSDRVQRNSRNSGRAPGVLPLFLFQHLLPMSVTLHKRDMATSIPSCTEHAVHIEATASQMGQFRSIKGALVARMRQDLFKEGRAGKLLGALASLPSFFDLNTTDTGNDGDTGDRSFVVQYPETVEGGGVIARATPTTADVLTPKEEWMLEKIRSNIAAGRNTMVFGWHTVSLARISRLVEKHVGVNCPILEASKVPTKTRQAWITKEIVKKNQKVMVTNPVAVQTGLNNLIHFSDVIWMENPACNPIVYRQANGRVDRIGQTLPTNIWFPIYSDTMQAALHNLLFRKVAVSLSTDGLDAESTMAAAGIGEDAEFSSLSVGRFLYQMVQED